MWCQQGGVNIMTSFDVNLLWEIKWGEATVKIIWSSSVLLRGESSWGEWARFMDIIRWCRPQEGRFGPQALKVVRSVMAVDLHLTLGLWLKDSIDCFTQDRFSPLVNGIPPLWPFLSSQKTITQPLLHRHWQGQGCQWIVEDYYFKSGIQFKQAPGRRKGTEAWAWLILISNPCLHVFVSHLIFLLSFSSLSHPPRAQLPPFTHFFSSYSPPSFFLCVCVCLCVHALHFLSCVKESRLPVEG